MKRNLNKTDNNDVLITPSKAKKPFYKKWWFWVIVICLIAGFGTGSSDKKEDTSLSHHTSEVSSADETKEDVSDEIAEIQDDVPREYKNALKSAESYASIMHMSKQAIYDQLTSEYGEKFAPEEAQYAVDNLQADYNDNALKKAESYSDQMSMSKDAIYDQLTSAYGEQFTAEEAQYAIDHLQ